eukprot:1674870-Amphidinium_carterae.1
MGEILAPETDMLVEEEGPEEGAKAKVLKGPDQPTAAEVEQHEAQGHLPYRRWCPQCVSARGVGQQHRLVAHAEEELPTVHLDFAFFSERVTLVVLYDDKTRSIGAVGLPHKG